MEKLIIQKLLNPKDMPWDLLLLADPSRNLVEKYVAEGQVYTASLNGKVIGVYVLTQLSPNVTELKNVAIDPNYQGKGYGKKLVVDAIEKAKEDGAKRIEVGTGNSSLSQLALYQKCGFRITGIEKDFFVKNYKEEIVENGIVCKDMIRLAIDFADTV